MSANLSSRSKTGPWPRPLTARDTRAALARIARHTLAHVPPADRITLALLALVTLVVAVATMTGGPLTGPLPPNAILELIMASIESAGGPHGAMPSLHVGVAAFLCAFDLRFNRLRGMACVPLVLLIGAATVYLRYHYAIDIIAGLTIALLAVHAAPLLQGGHRRRIGEDR
jgi:membrane-associated phospholipid phosphatase